MMFSFTQRIIKMLKLHHIILIINSLRDSADREIFVSGHLDWIQCKNRDPICYEREMEVGGQQCNQVHPLGSHHGFPTTRSYGVLR